MHYTEAEYRDILAVYLECGRNGRAAELRYSEMYPDRRAPTFITFNRTYDRFLETGGVAVRRQDRGVLVGPENLRQEEIIVNAILDNPKDSCRSLEKNTTFQKPKSIGSLNETVYILTT